MSNALPKQLNDIELLHLPPEAGQPSYSLLILPDQPESESRLKDAFGFLRNDFKLSALGSGLPPSDKVFEFTKLFSQSLEQQSMKRGTLLGISRGSNLAIAFTVENPGFVRRLLLIDPTARINPTRSQRVIDKIEDFLPLGLPLRPLNNEFDARPLLHRLRCPTLILNTPQASAFVRSESRLLQRKIPNARLIALLSDPFTENADLHSEFLAILKDFLEAPTKRSQKN